MNNQIKTVFLMVALSALFMFLGNLIGGRSGMGYALAMSLVMNFGAYWFSDKIVLAMHRAQPISRGDASFVYETIEEICGKAKLPMPKVYLIPQMIPNAFATGRNPEHAAVAVTQGILQILTPRELRGVLAHEMSHIKNRDILISTIVASMASAIMYLAHMMRWVGMSSSGRDRNRSVNPLVMILTIVVAPIAASLIQMAISRAREFMADESGALVSEDPEALASALQKISDPKLLQNLRTGGMLSRDLQPAFSHLYIVNQFSGESFFTLFSTHPPTAERVRRLLALKNKS